jgi:acetyltransferase-like isoleucine patch superfamily enzyme
VKPVRIHDNVWIGRNAIVHPGVTIGEGSIVSAGAVVMSDVPPMSIVAGNPARKIGTLDGSASTPREALGLPVGRG